VTEVESKQKRIVESGERLGEGEEGYEMKAEKGS
jgi:hypothetical protein